MTGPENVDRQLTRPAVAIVDVVVLDQPVEIPPEAPLLAVGQRHRGHRPQLGDVLERMLVADRIFDEERIELLHHLAGAHRVVEVEALVQVDAPVAVRTHALAHGLAVLGDPPDRRAGVEHPADRRPHPCGTRGSLPPS
jgi:hypothetical protein